MASSAGPEIERLISLLAKLPGIHADLKRKEVKLGADPKKVHLFANGRSLLYR